LLSVRSLSAAALALTGVAVLAPSAQAAKAATGWRVSLRVSTPESWLSGVAASDARSAWVVGFAMGQNSQTPVSYRWNGKRWAAAGITANQVSELSTVSTSGPTNTWAFGDKTLPGGGSVSRSLHWDGRTWAAADLPIGRRPLRGDFVSILKSVTLSPKDTWAFGVLSKATDAAYIAHFDGKRWKQIPAPQKLRPGAVTDAVALSGKDIWALAVVGNTWIPRVLHYDGRSWTIAGSPANFQAGGGLVVRSKNDIWLAGSRRVSVNQSQAGVMHFNGKKWSFVPVGTSRSAFVRSVADDGQGGLWAVVDGDNTSAIWHDVKGHWSKVTLANADILGLSHIPGTSTTFGVGGDGSGPAVFVTGRF
jgi:hypothetical protein